MRFLIFFNSAFIQGACFLLLGVDVLTGIKRSKASWSHPLIVCTVIIVSRFVLEVSLFSSSSKFSLFQGLYVVVGEMSLAGVSCSVLFGKATR